MYLFYWDASALGKRYTPELGTNAVNHLFKEVAQDRMMALLIALGEVMSILVRQRNAGLISHQAFAVASAQFKAEVVDAPDFRLEIVTQRLVHDTLAQIDKYALNATDALVLCSAKEVATELREAGDELAVVASDHRLLRAAQAEDLVTFNPEADAISSLEALIAAA